MNLSISNRITILTHHQIVSSNLYHLTLIYIFIEEAVKVFKYAAPSTLASGQKAAFTIFISSDTLEDDTETYEFTLQWQDDDFNDFSKRITG